MKKFTDSQASYQINIGLHVLILFTFLTVLFFAFISKLEQKSVSNALESVIHNEVGEALTRVNKDAKKEWNNDKLGIH